MNHSALFLAALLVATPAAQATPPAPTAAPAAEATPEAPAEPAAAKPVAKSDDKVCKLERQLGSNKMKRVCHTRDELDQQSEAARDALSREQRR